MVKAGKELDFTERLNNKNNINCYIGGERHKWHSIDKNGMWQKELKLSESGSVVSESMQPQKLYSRWNSPGQNSSSDSEKWKWKWKSLSCVQLFANPWTIQFSSVTQSCPTLGNPMNCSTPGLQVPHQLPEFTQTHVHRVGDATCHLILCHPLFLLPSIFPSIRVFSSESTLRMKWPKYWSFSFSMIPSKKIPGLISFRMDWLDLLTVQGTLKSLLQHHSSSINSLALSFLHSPTLTSIHDYWKNHNLD